MKMGNRTIAMSVIASTVRIAICIVYWSTQVSVSLGPRAQRFGRHWSAVATTLAIPQQMLIPKMAYEAYKTVGFGLMAMTRRVTAALAHAIARISRMFDAK